MTKSIDLELNEVDVLLCIGGIALDFEDNELIGNIVECMMSDMKGDPPEYRTLDGTREEAAVYVRDTLTVILKKLGG